MHRGYVKLWRKALDTPDLKDHKRLAFWVWCLMKASHDEKTVSVGAQKIQISPGQFVFGRKMASANLGMSESSIYRALKRLEACGQLEVSANNKFSVISIINWGAYQGQEFGREQRVNSKPNSKPNSKVNNKIDTKLQVITSSYERNKAGGEQQSEQLAEQVTEHKQEDKEVKRIYTPPNPPLEIPAWLPVETWNAFLDHRKKIKAPMTDVAVKMAIKKLGRLRDEGHDPTDVLNESIINGWKGVFPLKRSRLSGNGQMSAAAANTLKHVEDLANEL